MVTQFRAVITGGPHSGKTTLLNDLKHPGIHVVEETAIIEIEVLVDAMGADAAREWRRRNIAEFQRRVATRQAMAEALANDRQERVVLFDRGTIDCIAYCRFNDVDIPTEVLEFARSSHYDLAIVCDLVLPFNDRKASGRISTESAAAALDAVVEQVYREYGVPTVRLPLLPRQDRLNQLLSIISKYSGINTTLN